VPQIVHDLLNKLWHPNPESRPTFQEAIGLIDDVIFNAMIYDEESREFWKTSFGDRLEVKFKQFFAALYKRLNIQKPEKGLQDCIKLIFFQSSEKTAKVTITRFGKVVSWFGPLVIPRKTDDHLIDRITTLVTATWFWGDIDAKSAERMLNPQTFLLRLSNNNQIRKQPFTISIKLKAATHYRIDYLNDHYHLKNLPSKKGIVNLESRDIFGLIDKFTKSKMCKGVVPLEGSDFFRFLLTDGPADSVYGNGGGNFAVDDMFS